MRPLSIAVVFLAMHGLPLSAQLPHTPRGAVVDTLYGVPVADPYRWMEDASADEVRQWFMDQGAHARSTLDGSPGSAAAQAALQAIRANSPADVSLPYPVGGRWFYTLRQPGESVPRGYVRDGWSGEPRLLVDPAAMEGTGAKGANALGGLRPSPDGRLVLFGIVSGGSEDAVLHVRDVRTGRDLDEPIRRTRWALHRWGPDGRLFFYLQLNELPEGAPRTDYFRNAQVRTHVIGEPTSADVAVFSAAAVGYDDRLLPFVYVDSRHRLVIGTLTSGVERQSAYFVAPYDDVAAGEASWRPLFPMEDSVAAIAVNGQDLYALTFKGTGHGRVVRTTLMQPDLRSAEVIFEASGHVLQGMSPALDGLYVRPLVDGAVGLVRIPWHGPPTSIALPPGTSVSQVRASSRLPGVQFTLTSWTSVERFYRYDPSVGEVEEVRFRQLGAYDSLEDVRTETVLATAHDGVQVPLTIVRPEVAQGMTPSPVILAAYGSYGLPDLPGFFRELQPWVRAGGISATCHVRGGGYYGEEWHRAGQKANKPNTWKDLIACGEYLVREGYTTPEQLGIFGASAGGIAVGRALTDRPDLFRVAVVLVGVLDAVRFETTPNGPPNIPEMGSVATEDGFHALLEMSALHHVEPGTHYPAVLLTSGLNDPRVSPWQPGKMAAALQAASVSGRPVLLRVDEASGHFPDTQDQMDRLIADILTFAATHLGLRLAPPATG